MSNQTDVYLNEWLRYFNPQEWRAQLLNRHPGEPAPESLGGDMDEADEQEWVEAYQSLTQAHVEELELLLTRQPALAKRYFGGATLLHYALANASHYTADAVRCLLAYGADVQARTYLGETPLHYACRYSDTYEGNAQASLVRLLIAAGAQVNARDNAGVTPLHEAVYSGSDLAVTVLLAAGADANAHDREQVTPLHLAAWRGDPQRVAALIAAGADVNARDRYDNTPLHLTHSPEAAELLLQHGADIEARDDNGATPLHRAISHLSVLRVLLAHGADVNARDHQGRTARQIAESVHFNQAAIELLDTLIRA